MSNQNIEQLQSTDRNTVFHPSTHASDHAHGKVPVNIIQSGKGIYIRNQAGTELLDGFAGLYCVNVGYGRTEIADAIYEQAKKLAYYHTYVGHSNEAIIELSQRIIEWAPDGMRKVYYGLSGSDANETQIKLVRYYQNILGNKDKKKIISRDRGYHGSSIAAGSLTGLNLFHQAFDLPIDGILHTLAPHHYWNAEAGMSEKEFSQYCADELENMILAEGPETVGAFIGEPVMGTGGLIPPPEGYWDAVQKVLNKYDVLLIADEVVCGFGRIGTPFGSHLYGMCPDLITVAKGLTSAYLPLSGVIVGDKVWRVIERGSEELGPMGHGWTYSGHPLGAAAGLANLNILEKENLTENARDTGAYFQQKFHEYFDDHPLVGEVRGVGLMGALEFVADKTKKQRFDVSWKVGPKVSAACLEQKLIARAMPNGDILGFAPPLTITKTEVDDIVQRTKIALDAVADQLSKEYSWKG
ncbi:MAG: aspartate aminotransferase family protein [SAR324 cluster bacterium]|nr:aspartate aminotransferase family protein [SAR324 cluster bacterium]MBL7034117.1 aspartate aminotransferase family protein [SAR324 cluster bacterium]